MNLYDTIIYYLGLAAKFSPTSVPGPRTSSCVQQGNASYDYAKQWDFRKAMGVLDPVPRPSGLNIS